MISAYTSFFLYYTLARHYSFMTYMLDLGVYDHGFWTLLNDGLRGFPFQAIHSSELMYALTAIYALHPSAETLLVLQAPIVPLASLPLYKLAEHASGSKGMALAVAGLYLLYPPIHGVSAYDFHLEAFLPLFLLTLAYAYERGKWKLYAVALALLLSTMAPALYLAASSSVYLLARRIRQGSARRGTIRLRVDVKAKAAIAAFASSISLLAIVWLAAPSNPLVGFGSILQGPSAAQRAEYLVKLYAPLAFVPLLSPSHLIAAAPWLAYVMLGNISQEYLGIYNQYPAYVAPFIFMGLVDAVTKLRALGGKPGGSWGPGHRAVLLALLGCSLFLASSDPVFVAPYPPHAPQWPVPTERDRMLLQIIGQIPQDASVLTQNNIAPHLTNRREVGIDLQGWQLQRPDYILVDTTHFSYYDSILAQIVPMLVASGSYGLRLSCDGILLYQRGYMGQAEGCPASSP